MVYINFIGLSASGTGRLSHLSTTGPWLVRVREAGTANLSLLTECVKRRLLTWCWAGVSRTKDWATHYYTGPHRNPLIQDELCDLSKPDKTEREIG